MSFEEKTWQEEPHAFEVFAGKRAPTSETPLDAAGLNDLEARIGDGIGGIEGTLNGRPGFYVADYGAVGDGVADDTAALKAAAADWKAAGRGELVLSGTHKVSETAFLALETPGQSICGDGQSSAILKPTATVTGPVVKFTTLPGSDRAAGTISGITIDGTNAGEGAVGLNTGDAVGFSLRDLVVRGFAKAGQKGIEARNAAYWTEETVWDNVTLEYNKVCLELSRAEGANESFGYNTFDHLRVRLGPGQVGLRLKGDVKLYNTFLRMTGNLAGAGCIGIDLAESAQIWGLFDIGLETNEAGAVPVKMGASSLLKGLAYINTAVGGGVSESAGGTVDLSGHVRMPGISEITSEATFNKTQSITGESESKYTSEKAVALALAGKQPLDSDLTALAALTTTTFGRSLLTQATAEAARLLIEAQKTLGSESLETAMLKALAVTTAKLAEGAVTESKLGSEAVNSGAIKGLAVSTGKLSASAVTAPKIAEEAVEEAKLAAAVKTKLKGATRFEATFAIPGEITTASLEGLRHFISVLSGQTVNLVAVRARLGSGTSATFKVQKNGVDATGFTGVEAKSTEDKAVEPTAVSLANNDALSIIVTAVSGTPKNLSITLFIEKNR